VLHENQQRVAADLTNRDLKLTPPPGLAAQDLATWLSIKPDSVTIIRDGKSVTLTGEALVRWKYQRYMQDYLATFNRSTTASAECSRCEITISLPTSSCQMESTTRWRG
jgi:hypothetical protein